MVNNSPHIISWLLIFLGWAILIYNSNRIASRAEARAKCDRLISELKDAQSKTREIWYDSKDSEIIAEQRLGPHFSLIEVTNDHYNAISVGPLLTSEDIGKLRDICTSEYDELKEKPINDPQKIDSIQKALDYVTTCIEQAERSHKDYYIDRAYFQRIIHCLKEYPEIIGGLFASCLLFLLYYALACGL